MPASCIARVEDWTKGKVKKKESWDGIRSLRQNDLLPSMDVCYKYAHSQHIIPAASAWTAPTQAPPAHPPPPYNGYQQPCPPIVVNQHYYLNSKPIPIPNMNGKKNQSSLDKISDSVVGITKDVAQDVFPQLYDESVSAWQTYGPQLVNSTVAMVDQISSSFDRIMTMIDIDKIDRNDRDLLAGQLPQQSMEVSRRPLDQPKSRSKTDKTYHPKVQTTAVASAVVSGEGIRHPRGAEKDTHVSADWRSGTRAMVLKSVPMDDKSVIVFAIRGTANFMDWAVNLNMAPASPAGFLDDAGNLCHAGFLTSARKMVKPVAARLRQLLTENPGRSDYSLLITGHSAGGAVASLLYMHMLSTSRSTESELNILAGCFKRIHCITFGTPPVSLMPLTKPDIPQLKKSVFMSFINEGDPVVRADRAYVKTLIELLACPEPAAAVKSKDKDKDRDKKAASLGKPAAKSSGKDAKTIASKRPRASSKSAGTSSSSSRWSSRSPVWRVPNCTLSNAGRIVILRSKDPKAKVTGRRTIDERLRDGVVAHTATDSELRGVIWGDPLCHMMSFYSKRIEQLAVAAITAKGY
ncbi:unnamed protein product [Parascedosporium putredinis]|uniref:Fungal lipase-type domain-containing protein n=1 Tax=Parascedosporium putredinis TaxID=1442378 RepID=A0A9P1M927_9PEZI|nr:unnamed protein product [Parascedosporium putredinis]CAI7991205.1 unnamed protein product [Parascedosporium putredinis]